MRLPAWAVVAASAAGCSLIIPLDYTGGAGSASGGSAGTGQGGSGAGGTPQGGNSNGAEAGAGEGGNGEAGSVSGTGGSTGRGGSGAGGVGGSTGGVGGTANGGSGGVSGNSTGGEDPGGAPPEGGAGSGVGGSGGAGTTSGGRGGGGRGGASRGGAGMGGTAGGGMGGMGGCGGDLTSDAQHCGSCTNACPEDDECIDSVCVSSPCDEIGCGSVLTPDDKGDGPRKEDVGTNDVCVEVLTYIPNAGHLPAINCWNSYGRTIEVNKEVVACGSDQPLPMPKRKGGYCYHALPGDFANAGFVMPYAADNCCKTGGTGGT